MGFKLSGLIIHASRRDGPHALLEGLGFGGVRDPRPAHLEEALSFGPMRNQDEGGLASTVSPTNVFVAALGADYLVAHSRLPFDLLLPEYDQLPALDPDLTPIVAFAVDSRDNFYGLARFEHGERVRCLRGCFSLGSQTDDGEWLPEERAYLASVASASLSHDQLGEGRVFAAMGGLLGAPFDRLGQAFWDTEATRWVCDWPLHVTLWSHDRPRAPTTDHLGTFFDSLIDDGTLTLQPGGNALMLARDFASQARRILSQRDDFAGFRLVEWLERHPLVDDVFVADPDRAALVERLRGTVSG